MKALSKDQIVDGSPMTDRHNVQDALISHNAVDHPKGSRAIFPEPFEFSLERCSGVRISAEGSKGLFHIPFDCRWQMGNSVSHRRSKTGLPDHSTWQDYERFRVEGTKGSPKIVSNVRPLPPLAK